MIFLALISKLITGSNLSVFFGSVVFIYITIAFITLYLKKEILQLGSENFHFKENYL